MEPRFYHRFLILIAAGLMLAGCAHLPQPSRSSHVNETGSAGACARFFWSLDQAVKEAGVRDAGAFHVKGFPYLRVDRFLASFCDEVQSEEAFNAWVDQLQALDRLGRAHEIANLPRTLRVALEGSAGGPTLDEAVIRCGDLLRAADFRFDQRRKRLREVARAPDDYLLSRRVFGLYPVAGLFVRAGVKRWHEEARANFSNAPPDWNDTHYLPAANNDSRLTGYEILQEAPRDALGIPAYSDQALESLFQLYAPLWQVETKGDYDRIGAPSWTDRRRLKVDTGRHVTYRRLSFTRFEGRVLTQLNYVIWFPARPKAHILDLFGGFLDGVNFRVTLDTDGEPLLYETVHNCGCYHTFFPTERVAPRKWIDRDEPPLVLTAPRVDLNLERMVVGMDSSAHQVRHLYALPRGAEPMGQSYVFADYENLRSLPVSEDARDAMFRQDAIVACSERLERWILWPMGVLSPGAMRQWGRHSVAFVGKRHFDDPDLIGRIFERTCPALPSDRLISPIDARPSYVSKPIRRGALPKAPRDLRPAQIPIGPKRRVGITPPLQKPDAERRGNVRQNAFPYGRAL